MDEQLKIDNNSFYALILLAITAGILYNINARNSKNDRTPLVEKEAFKRLAFIIWINKNKRPLNITVRKFIRDHHEDKGVQLILLTNPENVSDLNSLPPSLEVGDIAQLKTFVLSDGRKANPQNIIQSSIYLTQNMDSNLMLAVASDFIRLLVLARPKEALDQMVISSHSKKKQWLSDIDRGVDVLYTDSDVKIDLTQAFTGMFPIFNIPIDLLDLAYYFFRNDVMYSSQACRGVFLSLVTALLPDNKIMIFQQALENIKPDCPPEGNSGAVNQFTKALSSFLPNNVIHPQEETPTSRLWSMALAGFHPAAAFNIVNQSQEAAPASLRDCMSTGNLVVFGSRTFESEVVSPDNVPRDDTTRVDVNGHELTLSKIASNQLSHELPAEMGKSWDGSGGELSTMESGKADSGLIRRCNSPAFIRAGC